MAGSNGHKPTLREQLATVAPREEAVDIPGLPPMRLRAFSRSDRRAYEREILGLPRDHEVRTRGFTTAFIARHIVDPETGERPFGDAIEECLELEDSLDEAVFSYLYDRVAYLDNWAEREVAKRKAELEESPPFSPSKDSPIATVEAQKP